MPHKDPAVRKAYKAAYHATHREEDNARSAARRLTHLEEERVSGKAYRATHSEPIKIRKTAYNAARREERNAYMATYSPNHREDKRAYDASRRETLRVYDRDRHKANPEIKQAAGQRRRARKAAAPINDFTAAQRKLVKEHYGYRCVYCGIKFPSNQLTMDHITPYIHKGSNTLWNIVPACQSCNARKGKGPPLVPVQPLLL